MPTKRPKRKYEDRPIDTLHPHEGNSVPSDYNEAELQSFVAVSVVNLNHEIQQLIVQRIRGGEDPADVGLRYFEKKNPVEEKNSTLLGRLCSGFY